MKFFTILSILYFLISASFQLKAQTNTQYLDHHFSITKDTLNAQFKKEVVFSNEKNLYFQKVINIKTNFPVVEYYSFDLKGEFFFGLYKEWYPSGDLKQKGKYEYSSKYGNVKKEKWQEWYPKNKLKSIKYYSSRREKVYTYNSKDGEKIIKNGNGKFVSYWENSDQIKEMGKYVDATRQGKWEGYTKDGKLAFEEKWDRNKITSGTSWDNEGNEYNYNDCRIQFARPELNPLGITLSKKLQERIIYPEEALKNKLGGEVFLEFTVEIDGSISNVKAIAATDVVFVEEAIRVLKSYKKPWIPYKNKGKIEVSKSRYKVTFWAPTEWKKKNPFVINKTYFLNEKQKIIENKSESVYTKLITKKNGEYFTEIRFINSNQIHTSFYSLDKRGIKKNGIYAEYNENNYLTLTGQFFEGNKVGKWSTYDQNGLLKEEVTYPKSRIYPLFTSVVKYHENGNISEKGSYVGVNHDKQLRKVEKWKCFYEDGGLKMEIDYAKYDEESYNSREFLPLTTNLNYKESTIYREYLRRDNYKIVSLIDEDGVSLVKKGNGLAYFYDKEQKATFIGLVRKGKKFDHWLYIEDNLDPKKIGHQFLFKTNLVQDYNRVSYETSDHSDYSAPGFSHIQNEGFFDIDFTGDDVEKSKNMVFYAFFHTIIESAIKKEIYLSNRKKFGGNDYYKAFQDDVTLKVKLINATTFEVSVTKSVLAKKYTKAIAELHQEKYQLWYKNFLLSLKKELPDFYAEVMEQGELTVYLHTIRQTNWEALRRKPIPSN
ncbi:hypothetical protein EI427_20875 [Flammeovirga pectinis]|uniref:TonB C-terminal domain-containing protein n=1 Tax=Flammeovirga pectinis TaxID=2494373 RepID=A0A3Q9FTG6_9BACT|nr:energy transducer TonB [Flammeovirga pectinis]AZQ64680.1 hypothetical protein EI427_20875 [Flammeovirga pectinis]